MKTFLHISKAAITLLGLVLFTFTNVYFATAQPSLKGLVTSSSTKGSIPFATVALYQNNVLITGTDTDYDGNYVFANLYSGTYTLEVNHIGFSAARIDGVLITKDSTTILNIELSDGASLCDEIIVTDYRIPLVSRDETSCGAVKNINSISSRTAGLTSLRVRGSRSTPTQYYIDGVRVSYKVKRLKSENPPFQNTEEYVNVTENAFQSVESQSVSTFSIDVDRASYSNIRRLINTQQLPTAGAVRIEEMINYFDYEYADPFGDHPFGIHTDMAICPWNTKHQILKIGIQGRRIDTKDLPPSNFVFLIDVSGSMNSANKLPLVKESFKLLLDNLRPADRVAIVTYAGRSAVVLESTPLSAKNTILEAIEKLNSGGSTAGAEGILSAYQIAEKNFIRHGNNRVILATDGDFNVGVSSTDALEKLIEEKRKTGVYLSVLGYGVGNYKDNRMQTLANKGNGNHAYIDAISEARKVFVEEFAGTLFTIAKDVKIQIEFNPIYVASYRLIGYENRMLENQDFKDDKKDAGELGAGHSVTALYEIIPKGTNSKFDHNVDPLKYQVLNNTVKNAFQDEVATVQLRYKHPSEKKSKLLTQVVNNQKISEKNLDPSLAFCLAVAEFGLLLKDSEYKHKSSIGNVLKLATAYRNTDDAEKDQFIEMVKAYKVLSEAKTASVD